jgi:hypothetical protein
VLTVTGVQGQRITLSNGKTWLESELLKVNSAEPNETDPIDILNKEMENRNRIDVKDDMISRTRTHGRDDLHTYEGVTQHVHIQ